MLVIWSDVIAVTLCLTSSIVLKLCLSTGGGLIIKGCIWDILC